MDNYKTRKMLREGLDPEQVRGALNRMIQQFRSEGRALSPGGK
ncbi:MAG TPA: hypothetical protein VFZ16_15430 [Hyphomicrobiaceae bacterium]|nr:hypothetical protein [Hyphomicrobiaceae bacterium]